MGELLKILNIAYLDYTNIGGKQIYQIDLHDEKENKTFRTFVDKEDIYNLLPKDKWCITSGGANENEYNYLIEHRNPVAEFYNGKWHIYMEEIKCRTIIGEYDTKEEAEKELIKLNKETGK